MPFSASVVRKRLTPSVLMCLWMCVQEMVSAITTAVAMASSPGREAQVSMTRQQDPLNTSITFSLPRQNRNTHPCTLQINSFLDRHTQSLSPFHRHAGAFLLFASPFSYHSLLLTHLSIGLFVTNLQAEREAAQAACGLLEQLLVTGGLSARELATRIPLNIGRGTATHSSL